MGMDHTMGNTMYTDANSNPQPKVTKRDISLPFSEKLIFVLDNVFTPEECEEYIKKTEKMGYEAALVNVGCK